MRGWKRLFRLTESHRHIEAQVDDELGHHVEELFERYRARGMSKEEAGAAIRQRFDDLESTRTALVEGSGRTLRRSLRRFFLNGLRGDIRVSLRQFRKHPGFTALAVTPVMLALVQEAFPENRALANGVYMSMSFGLRSVVVVVLGGFGDLFGLRLAFGASAVITLLGLPLLLLLPGKRGVS